MEFVIGAIIAITVSLSIIITALDLMKKNQNSNTNNNNIKKYKQVKQTYFDLTKFKFHFLYFYGEINGLDIKIDSIAPIKVEKEEVLKLVDDLIDDNSDYFFILFDQNLFLQVERESRTKYKITYRKVQDEMIKVIPDFDLGYYVNEIFSEKK
jgi:hypothetical protein